MNNMNKLDLLWWIFNLVLLLAPSIVTAAHFSAPALIWATALIPLALPLVLARSEGGFFLLAWPILLLAPPFCWFVITNGVLPSRETLMVLLSADREEVVGFVTGANLTPWLALCIAANALYLAVAIRLFRKSLIVRRHLASGILILGSPGLIMSTDAFPYSYPMGMVMLVAEDLPQAVSALDNKPNHIPFAATATHRPGREAHVLIIGESARFDAWHMHGYRRDTSPILDQLPNVVDFTSAWAAANTTNAAVPILVTGLKAQAYSPERIHGDIFGLMKEAGYTTNLFVNQDMVITNIVGPKVDWFVYTRPDNQVYDHVPYDEVALPLLDRALRKSDRTFVAMHTFGSHWIFDRRYPATFREWGNKTAPLAGSDTLDYKDDQALRDAYDNSIKYSDWVIGQVIKSVAALKIPATVTYISDHGQSFVASEGLFSHGMPKFSRAEAHVPLFIWVSPEYQRNYPGVWQDLQRHKDSFVSTDMIFHTLADVAGIRYPSEDRTRSIASPTFTVAPPEEIGKATILAGGKLSTLAHAFDWSADHQTRVRAKGQSASGKDNSGGKTSVEPD